MHNEPMLNSCLNEIPPHDLKNKARYTGSESVRKRGSALF